MNVFSFLLNSVQLTSLSRRLAGKLFKIRGPAASNPNLPSGAYNDGTRSSAHPFDLGRRCFVLSELARPSTPRRQILGFVDDENKLQRHDVRSDTDLRRQSAARRAAVIGAILRGLRPLPSCPSVCPLFLRRTSSRERSPANLNANRTGLCRRPTGNGAICEKISHGSRTPPRARDSTIK